MAKQVSFDDIIPGELKKKVIDFTTERYMEQQDARSLPSIKNRHEAYGVLAEASVSLASAASAVKSAVSDGLNALPASDAAFNEAADMAYAACISAAQAAVNMAVHAQNISLQWINRHSDEPMPLIDGAESEMSEIPDTDENMEENEDGE